VKLFLKNKNNILDKNHSEIQVCIILLCALYSIKYANSLGFFLQPFRPFAAAFNYSLSCNLSLERCFRLSLTHSKNAHVYAPLVYSPFCNSS
jgi:hypothetical protein